MYKNLELFIKGVSDNSTREILELFVEELAELATSEKLDVDVVGRGLKKWANSQLSKANKIAVAESIYPKPTNTK